MAPQSFCTRWIKASISKKNKQREAEFSWSLWWKPHCVQWTTNEYSLVSMPGHRTPWFGTLKHPFWWKSNNRFSLQASWVLHCCVPPCIFLERFSALDGICYTSWNLHLSFCANASCFFSYLPWAFIFSNFIVRWSHSSSVIHLTVLLLLFFFLLLQILMSVQLRCITVMPTLYVSTCPDYIAVTVSQGTFVWMTSLVQVSAKKQCCFSDSILLCIISVLFHLAPSTLILLLPN